jgi:hypothetical protein
VTVEQIAGLIFGGGGILVLVFAFLRGDIVTKAVHDRYVASQETTIGKLTGEIVTKLGDVAEAQSSAAGSLAEIARAHGVTAAGIADVLEHQARANEGLAETLTGIGQLIIRHDNRLAAHNRQSVDGILVLKRIDRRTSAQMRPSGRSRSTSPK